MAYACARAGLFRYLLAGLEEGRRWWPMPLYVESWELQVRGSGGKISRQKPKVKAILKKVERFIV